MSDPINELLNKKRPPRETVLRLSDRKVVIVLGSLLFVATLTSLEPDDLEEIQQLMRDIRRAIPLNPEERKDECN